MVASQPARPITNQPIDKKSFEKFTQTNLGYLRFRTAGVAASFPESQFQPADNVNYKQHIVSTYTGQKPEKLPRKNPMSKSDSFANMILLTIRRRVEKTSSRFMYEPWRGRKNNHRE